MLRALVVGVAPTFVALATGAPLLQRWWARLGGDPAGLVAASNAGSLAALLAYPLAIERLLPLAAQARAFAALWGVWVAGTIACAALAARAAPAAGERAEAATVPARRWLRYAAFAATPAKPMMGVTTHLATDVGSFPSCGGAARDLPRELLAGGVARAGARGAERRARWGRTSGSC